MIELLDAGAIPEYCNACKSRDTDDPKIISISIKKGCATKIVLCFNCRLELIKILTDSYQNFLQNR